MTRTETPEQVAFRCVRDLRESLRNSGRTWLRYGITLDGLRLTVGSRIDEDSESLFDIPPLLRPARPSTHRVYRALRDLRGERGSDVAIMPADIRERLEQLDPDSEQSIDTINHALRDLRNRKAAYTRPDRGWLLGTEQPRLPNSGGQSDADCVSDFRGYLRDVANVGVRRFTEGEQAMPRTLIWVPGEKTEEYGVIVTDAKTESLVQAVDCKISTMQVPTRSGRLTTVDAARGELLRVEGKYAVVKIAGKQVAVRVLGDWHLKGLQAPEPINAA